MRRPPAPRRGQIGNYWLGKKTRNDRSDPMWYRTWYDVAARQTRRIGLGTTDFQEAAVRLAAWIVENERTHLAAPGKVLIESILPSYWNDYAKDLPSAETQRLGLSYWQEFWAKRTIAAITPQEQRRFRDWLAKSGTGISGIDRILSVGCAALNRALKWQEVSSVPPHLRDDDGRSKAGAQTERPADHP